ncbi:MAG TPA: hypothetical protein VMF03_09605 [Steroidobacteraceae bacterium]|nr:hypothetical protein [Steroidobacteraceae bacterium]
MARLRTLQADVAGRAIDRNRALRMFLASRHVTTAPAQRELWLEFSWAEQEYRSSVHTLAVFCRAVRYTEADAVIPSWRDL